MPSSCSAYGCTNRSSMKDCIDRKVIFHRFPLRNPNLLKQWLVKMKRVNFEPTLASRICSDHFKEECYTLKLFNNTKILNKDAVPTVFVFNKEPVGKHTKYQFEMKVDLGQESSTITEKAVEKNFKMSYCLVPVCNSGYRSQHNDFRKLENKMPGLFTCSIQTSEVQFVKLDAERETSVYDPKTDSFELRNAQLKKDVSSLFSNSSIYKSKKRFWRENPEERCIRLENEQLRNDVQLSLKNFPENQNLSENSVKTFLAPLKVYKEMDLTASDSVHWNKNEMTALIALYQSEKCLYDRKHEHYYDVHEKNKAYERIKTVLGNINFIFTSSQIQSKIASLYSEYASEKAYKDRCIQAGQFTENTYAPTMWCFGLLQFLDDYMETRAEIEIKAEAMEEENQHEIQFLNSNVEDLNIKIETEEISNMEQNVPLKIDSSFSLNADFNKNFKKEKETSICDENWVDSNDLINEINSRRVVGNLKISTSNKLNSIKIFSEDSEEKEDVFGEYIASEMKTLKDNPVLYIQTKQAIIDVLTSANFDLLNLE